MVLPEEQLSVGELDGLKQGVAITEPPVLVIQINGIAGN
jgi:hypothetical protein